jgi:plasmid stabilization system protein ParE
VDDLSAIVDFIRERNPAAARLLAERLLADAEMLSQLPALYRPGRVPGTREFVSHPNYILIYRLVDGAIEILNVVHSRQQYPNP